MEYSIEDTDIVRKLLSEQLLVKDIMSKTGLPATTIYKIFQFHTTF